MVNLPRPTRDNGGFQPKIAQEVNPNVAILNSSTPYSLVHYRAACLPGALRYDPTAWQSDALQVQYPPPSHPLPRLPGHQAPWGPVWCAHAISRGKGVRCPPSRIFFSADQMAIYIFSPEMLKILTTRVQSRFRGGLAKEPGPHRHPRVPGPGPVCPVLRTVRSTPIKDCDCVCLVTS